MESEASTAMMVEARRSERIRSFLRARIIFNNGASTIDCVVKNISLHGAKLDIVHSLSIPAEFDLEVPQRGRTYRAKMMWRAADSIGVEFVEPSAANDTGTAAKATIERLETENRKLRATVTHLTKRLEDLGQTIRFE